MIKEKRIVHHAFGLYCAGIIQQNRYDIVAFAIKRWEKENQNRQDCSSQSDSFKSTIDAPENLLKPIHRSSEIKRKNAAESAQTDRTGHTLNDKGIV